MDSARMRRSDRIMMAIRVMASGNDAHGALFLEETIAVGISRHGARIILKEQLKPHAEVSVRNIATGLDADMKVIGQIATSPLGYHYGMRYSNPESDIWGIAFPPISESEKAAGKVVLECAVCRSAAVVYLQDFEMEVFEAQGDLVLTCKKCRRLTSWKVLEREPSPPIPPARVAEVMDARTPPPQAEGRERRAERRLSLRMDACIRTHTYGDDVVPTQNVSRGGFGFKSPRKYGEGVVVEVSVPFSEGFGNIFSIAKIAGVRPLPQESTNAYGVSYLKNSAVWSR